MRQVLKRRIASSLVKLATIFPAHRIPVLAYHSIDSSGSVISTSRDLFEAQMVYLYGQGYRTINLDEYLERLKTGGGKDRKEVVLTFDDGFENNYTVAFPILKRLGFTATIFLTTGYLGKTCKWQKDQSIGALPLLSWEQVLEMSEEGFSFGSHTISHADLTTVTEDEAEREIAASKESLETRLSKSVSFFCYPYGNRTPAIEGIVRRQGYLGACTTVYGMKNQYEDRYHLKRLGAARFSSNVDFQAGVLGTYGLYVRIRDIVKPT
jgi:peptidoglycan/xylan/chitin deacetylase (PgdA/CDA1 family)